MGDRDNNDYTLDDIQTIINTMIIHGCSKVTILGGEPTIHPQLFDIIQLIKSSGCEVVLDTSGSFPSTFFNNEHFTKINTICFKQHITKIDS